MAGISIAFKHTILQQEHPGKHPFSADLEMGYPFEPLPEFWRGDMQRPPPLLVDSIDVDIFLRLEYIHGHPRCV